MKESTDLSNEVEVSNASPRILVNLGAWGFPGRLVGILICSLIGILSGSAGSLVAGLIPIFGVAGLLGQEEPSILGLVVSGAWIYAILGVVPGLIIGAYYGVSPNQKGGLTAVFVLVALLAGCASEWVVARPINVVGWCFYYLAPWMSVIIAIPFVRIVKVRLGMYSIQRAGKVEREIDEYFTDLGT